MYVRPNLRTKKALKEAIAVGLKVAVFQPGPFGTGDVESGGYGIEGPHYPEPHRWYAFVVVKDGKVVKVT